MTKALGKDINDFWNNNFPANSYLDEHEEWIVDEYEDENGVLRLPETEKFELDNFGLIFFGDDTLGKKFATAFKRWLKQKKTASIVVEVAVEQKQAVVEQLRAMGLKVVI